MEKKLQFVSLAATGRSTFMELRAEFHVSRRTGHKWRERYRREGVAGLRERSRRRAARDVPRLDERKLATVRAVQVPRRRFGRL